MTPPLNNAYLSSHSSLEKSGVHFGNLGTFCVGDTFQNERFSKTPNTAVYAPTILINGRDTALELRGLREACRRRHRQSLRQAGAGVSGVSGSARRQVSAVPSP